MFDPVNYLSIRKEATMASLNMYLLSRLYRDNQDCAQGRNINNNKWQLVSSKLQIYRVI